MPTISNDKCMTKADGVLGLIHLSHCVLGSVESGLIVDGVDVCSGLDVLFLFPTVPAGTCSPPLPSWLGSFRECLSC